MGRFAVKERIQAILDPYAEKLPLLECDGFTRVASYLLTQNGIEHQCYIGKVECLTRTISLHFWIIAGEWTVDYVA